MARLRFPGLALAAEVALSAALETILRRLDALEKKPSAPALVVRDFSAHEGQYVRVQAPPTGLRVLLPKPTSNNRGAEITFSLETTGPVTFLCVDGLVNREEFVVSTLLGTFKAVCNGETGWSVGFGVTSSGNTPGPAGPQGVQGDPGEQGAPGEPGPPGDTANPLRPIADQRVLGNDSGAIAYPAPITVHQELDWLGDAASFWAFDGVDDRVDFGDFNGFERTQSFSLSVWFQRSALGTGVVFLSKSATTSDQRGYLIGQNSDNTLAFRLNNNVAAGGTSTIVINSTASYSDTSAHHFLVTYSGTSTAAGVTFYLDGVAIAMTTVGAGSLTSTAITTAHLCVGGKEDGSAPAAATLYHAAIWGSALSAAQVVEAYGGGSPPDLNALATAPAPQFWAKLDDTDTAETSGVIDHGTGVHNGSARGGVNANLWVFDGVNDEIQMGDVLDMTRTTPRSVFVWYAASVTGNVAIGKQNAASTAGWRFAVPSSSSTQDVILSNAGGGQQIQVGASPRPPSNGTEHHFGWTYNGNSSATGFTFYLDGAATGKSTGTNNLTSGDVTNAEPLQIGNRGTTAPFAGTIRHVSVWNRELTAGEAAQVYGSGTPPDLSALSFFADCIGWWRIDGTDSTAGNGVVDHSASAFHGTASGGLAPPDSSADISTGALAVRGSTIWQLIAPGATGAYLMSAGTSSIPVWASPANQTASTTGTQNALTFPSGFKNRDTLDLTLTGNTTLNGIDATSIPSGFEFVLRVGTSGGFTLTIANESASATATNRLNTPDNISVLIGEDGGVYIRRALTRWLIVDRGWPNASTSIVYSSRAIQRAALTGAVTASQDSNTTAFGTAAAKSVLTNATNATAVPAFLAGTAARQVFRINAANTATEWGTLTSDSLPSGPRGEDGAEGPPGDMGPPGPTGATGPTGLQGPPGIDGNDGVDGIDGAVGATGATGATGPQGPPGAQGEQGDPGDMGPQGATGAAAYVEQSLALVVSNASTLNFTTGNSTAAAVTDAGGGRATIAINYAGTTSNINLTPSGAQGVIDISTLNCGGSVTLQPSAAFDIDGFTQRQDGFWFDLIYRDTTGHLGTLNENAGATTTSIRNPHNLASHITRQQVTRLRYQNSRWRAQARDPLVLLEAAAGLTLAAGQAQYFAKNDTPNNPYFRDDTNADRKIATAPVPLTDMATIATGRVLGLQFDAASSAVPVALTGAEVAENFRRGTVQTEDGGGVGASGALNITLAADTTVLLIRTSADATLHSLTAGTGAGREIMIEHDRLSGSGNLTIAHNSGAATFFKLFNPGLQDFVLTQAECCWVRDRSSFWRTQGLARPIRPDGLAIVASNIGVPFTIRVTFAAGGGGAADDVTVYAAAAPFAFRIIDVTVMISAAIALATVQLRDTTGGGGSTLSSSLSAAATGTVRNADTASRTVAAAGSVYLRRSDNAVAGEVIITAVRT